MAYLTTIPQPTDKFSVSQGQIQQNFLISNTVFGINHYPFTITAGDQGKHIFVQMPVLSTIPAGILAGEGCLYTKTATISGNPQTQLFYHQDLTSNGNEYQLTRADSVNAATFRTFINYTPYPGGSMVPNQIGGWTFLPGGLLYQYGKMQTTGNNTTVVFPIAFTTIYNVIATRQQGVNGTTSWGVSSVGNSSFALTSNSSTVGTTFYWTAIGV